MVLNLKGIDMSYLFEKIFRPYSECQYYIIQFRVLLLYLHSFLAQLHIKSRVSKVILSLFDIIEATSFLLKSP